MKVLYRKLFLKDLKKLSKQPIYDLKKYPRRYRIRVGNYRIGIEVKGDTVEVMRVLHRGDFYRYFP